MTNHIHIAFSFDNEYIGQSGVSIHSILKNVYEYDCIHILVDCISKKINYALLIICLSFTLYKAKIHRGITDVGLYIMIIAWKHGGQIYLFRRTKERTRM